MYFIAGSLWITFSDDWLAAMVSDVETLTRLQSYKGLFYIAITALSAYALLIGHRQAILETNANYLGVFHQSPLPIWIYSMNHRTIHICNPATLAKFGYNETEFRHLDEDGLYPSNGVYSYRKKNGETFIAQVNTAPIRFNQEPCVIVMARDITKLTKANDELEERVRERTRELSLINKEMESFSYSVSHDLQAPLRAVVGFSQELLEMESETLSETGKSYLQRIQKAGNNMGSLINDLLTLSKVTRFKSNPADIELQPLVSGIAAMLQMDPRYAHAAVDIRLEGVMCNADETLISILFQNLLSNALKYSSTKDHPHVEVGTITLNHSLIFFVRDNGVGFDMAYANKLFIPFQRLHKSSEFEGTGIGLATVQRVLRHLKGIIWVESIQGEHTIFYITLPK
jgi:signal transduction histidine kinase